MILWIDAQLSPSLAPWITGQFGIEAYSVKWLGYRDASDHVIFQAAREAGVTVMTKDSDFLRLLDDYGPPPQVLWVTMGNTSKCEYAGSSESSASKGGRYAESGRAACRDWPVNQI